MRKCSRIFITAVIVLAIIYLKILYGPLIQLNEPRLTVTGNSPQIDMSRLPKDDESRLVDLTRFHYSIAKPNICVHSNVLLFVVVSSAPENSLKRAAIRETWGQKDEEIKLVFTFGKSNTTLDATLQAEDLNYKDIIQGNFIDSYKNMTYKSTMGLKYVLYNCPLAKFILKCDDDVFVNMPLLKNFLKNDLGRLRLGNAIFCNVNAGSKPVRHLKGPYRKWYVSYEVWPDEKYPDYCSGFYSIMTPDAAFNIYTKAQKTTFFWIDDIFLTGMAARQVQGLQYVDLTGLTLTNRNLNLVLYGLFGDVVFLFGGADMSPEEIRTFWRYVVSRSVRESVFNRGVVIEKSM